MMGEGGEGKELEMCEETALYLLRQSSFLFASSFVHLEC